MAAKMVFTLSMLIFGTISIISKFIGLSAGVLSLYRCIIAIPFLLLVVLFSRKKIDFKAIKKNWLPIVLSGIGIGGNWILVFKAFDYISVSMTVTINYLAPIIVILLAPLLLKEKLTFIKSICVAVALVGMLLVGNIFNGNFGGNSAIGFAMALGAACLYALMMLSNKFLKDIKGVDSCISQLFVGMIVILIYVLCAEDITSITRIGSLGVGLVFLLGIVHTGLAYLMYFNTILKMKGQEIAIFSYMDPITSIILSAVALHEPMSVLQIVGTCLILVATLSSELFGRYTLKELKTKFSKSNKSKPSDIETVEKIEAITLETNTTNNNNENACLNQNEDKKVV